MGTILGGESSAALEDTGAENQSFAQDIDLGEIAVEGDMNGDVLLPAESLE